VAHFALTNCVEAANKADKSSVHLSAVRMLLGFSEDCALQQVRAALFGKQPVTQTARIVSKYKNGLSNNHVHYRQAETRLGLAAIWRDNRCRTYVKTTNFICIMINE
jgi:hypothetical protein